MKSIFHKETPRLVLRGLLSALFLLPIFWMLTTSLKPLGTPISAEGLSFSAYTFENFVHIWQVIPLGTFTLNSMKVVLLAVPITIIVSSWAGFSISQLSHPSRRFWITVSLLVLMVPGIALWSSRFVIYKAIGWHNSIWALIAPAWMGTSPFYVLIFYRAFRRIPSELYDIARLEGAGVLAIWGKIALPIARTTTLGVALLSFVVYWGDFISPLLYLQSEKQYTLAIALQFLQQLDKSNWSLLMTGAVLTTSIPVILFLFVQTLFTSPKN